MLKDETDATPVSRQMADLALTLPRWDFQSGTQRFSHSLPPFAFVRSLSPLQPACGPRTSNSKREKERVRTDGLLLLMRGVSDRKMETKLLVRKGRRVEEKRCRQLVVLDGAEQSIYVYYMRQILREW